MNESSLKALLEADQVRQDGDCVMNQARYRPFFVSGGNSRLGSYGVTRRNAILRCEVWVAALHAAHAKRLVEAALQHAPVSLRVTPEPYYGSYDSKMFDEPGLLFKIRGRCIANSSPTIDELEAKEKDRQALEQRAEEKIRQWRLRREARAAKRRALYKLKKLAAMANEQAAVH